MGDNARHEYSPRRQALRVAITLAVANGFLLSIDNARHVAYFDLAVAALMLALLSASRIWPDKIWIRRAGEPTWSSRTKNVNART